MTSQNGKGSDRNGDIQEREQHSMLSRILAALFYALASILIVFGNKFVLTNFHFPSFHALALGQMLATLLTLHPARFFGWVSYPPCSWEVVRKIFPLPVFYAVNLMSGLGSTQKLSLPMFTVMRRLSILLTMIGEYFLLGIRASWVVQLSVLLMVLGSFIAAANDLTFDPWGYFLITVNNVCTAGNGLYMKRKLNANDLGKYGLLYYNALFSFPFATLVLIWEGKLDAITAFESWRDWRFLSAFAFCCFCGFVLNFAILLCTLYNSPLTTTCVGAMKNIVVTYGGMFTSGDYKFSPWNFWGINLSVVGSLIYTWITFVVKGTDRRGKTASKVVTTLPKEGQGILRL